MEHDIIKGLYYIPNYLTQQQYDNIMTNLLISTNWSTVGSSTNSRRVLQYGYSYAYNRSGIEKIEPIPELYKNLIDIDNINNILGIKLLDNNNFQQLIVNEYKPGQGIYKHIDHTKYFGPIILCITCGSGVNMEFSINDQIINFYVKPYSMYIMSGDARHLWKHGIKATSNDVIIENNKKNKVKRGTRYSITFRSVN
jgi:alkylated DNA repair dioxygenase AlkB